MATIPLPALDTRPIAAPPNPLDEYAKAMAIKSAQNQQSLFPLQQQEAQNQVQSGQLQVQQQQMQLKDQQTLRSLAPNYVTKDDSGKVTGYDYDGFFNAAATSGVSPQTLITIQKGINDTALAKQNLTAAQLKNQQTANGEAFDHIEGLRGTTDPAQRQQMWSGTVMPWVQKNASALGVNPGALPVQAPDDNGLASLEASLGMHAQMLNDAKTKTDIKATQDTAAARVTGANTAAQELAGKLNPQSPLYAPSPAAVAMGTAPGAAAIQANEVTQAGAKAAAEAQATQPYKIAEDRQRQVLQQGDPNAAGKLLVDGDATLSELKTRGATPQFIEQALDAAKQQSGGKYNAQAADAQFTVAKSPTNVAFFGSAKSLTDPGGTLDQLAAASQDIPRGKFPVGNTVADWEKVASGSGPIAKYASLALGASDDYSKVMGGGQGSDTSRSQALKLFNPASSPDQKANSFAGVRGAVMSQMNSRIGENPVLKRMYGSASAAQQQPNAQPTPQTHTFSLSAWQTTHPGGDANAAKVAAQQQGYQVVP